MRLNQYNTPLVVAFIGSLLLSFVALQFNPIIARDSAFYLDIALDMTENGFADLTARFNWPWLSALISFIHQITGLSILHSGYVITWLLTAATCALLTRSSQLLNPASAWWACLISLSIPAFNSYRDNILREPGQWLAASLLMAAVILWQQRNQSRYLLVAIVAVFTGSLFRLEAVFMIVPLISAVVWQLRRQILSKHVIVRAGFALLLAGTIAASIMTTGLIDNGRVLSYINLLDPAFFINSVQHNADILAATVLEKYSHDDATAVLLFGFAGVITLKIILLCGPFLAAMALQPKSIVYRPKNASDILLFTAISLYALILLIFALRHNFMIDRYVSLVHIFATPLLAAAAVEVRAKYKTAANLIIILAILTGLNNVVSLSDKRTHYLEAGQWIKENVPSEAPAFYSDGRVSFYAGRSYPRPAHDEKHALTRAFADFDYFVIDNLESNQLAQEKLHNKELLLLAEFDNGKRHHLAILGKP